MSSIVGISAFVHATVSPVSPIESLDVHLGLVCKERLEVECHHLVGARQILSDSLIEVMRVEKPSTR